jgi:predicted aldo/keto reductase-like oxidoreductase
VGEIDQKPISSLGIGTHMGGLTEEDDQKMEQAISSIISAGCSSVVDTSVNYRAYRSLHSLGRFLDKQEKNPKQRKSVFVSSKVGSITHNSLLDIDPSVQLEYLDKIKVLPKEDIINNSICMSVSYLEWQLEQTLIALKTDFIDLLYLHNFFEVAKPRLDDSVFYKGLTIVVEWLESKREEGKIGGYGLATWDSLRVDYGKPQNLPLDNFMEIVKSVAGSQNGFQAIQMPFNYGMMEALFVDSQFNVESGFHTALDWTSRHQIKVFASAPLMNGRLISQAVPQIKEGFTNAQSCMMFSKSCPGITCALVGLKKDRHIEEFKVIAKLPRLSVDQFNQIIYSKKNIVL